MSQEKAKKYYQGLYESSFTQAAIGSYAMEFLPLAIERGDVLNFSHALVLGCGHGADLIACRIFFGDTIRLTGVDNNRALLSGSDEAELKNNMQIADGDFMFARCRTNNCLQGTTRLIGF